MSDHTTPLGGWLARKNIKPATFARTLGVSRSYLSELLSGKKLPSRTLALTIEHETEGAIVASVSMGLKSPPAAVAAEAGA